MRWNIMSKILEEKYWKLVEENKKLREAIEMKKETGTKSRVILIEVVDGQEVRTEFKRFVLTAMMDDDKGTVQQMVQQISDAELVQILMNLDGVVKQIMSDHYGPLADVLLGAVSELKEKQDNENLKTF
jgi:hypothetical protein